MMKDLETDFNEEDYESEISEPCPFCEDGGYPVLVDTVQGEDVYCNVICIECGAEGPKIYYDPDKGYDDEDEVNQLALGKWASRFNKTTRRIVSKHEDGSRYSWCESCRKNMNESGDYCNHCHAKVIEEVHEE